MYVTLWVDPVLTPNNVKIYATFLITQSAAFATADNANASGTGQGLHVAAVEI